MLDLEDARAQALQAQDAAFLATHELDALVHAAKEEPAYRKLENQKNQKLIQALRSEVNFLR